MRPSVPDGLFLLLASLSISARFPFRRIFSSPLSGWRTISSTSASCPWIVSRLVHVCLVRALKQASLSPQAMMYPPSHSAHLVLPPSHCGVGLDDESSCITRQPSNTRRSVAVSVRMTSTGVLPSRPITRDVVVICVRSPTGFTCRSTSTIRAAGSP